MERKIEQGDLDSATRGLQMRRQPDEYLMSLIELHDANDMFASKVIAHAARDELAKRGVQHA